MDEAAKLGMGEDATFVVGGLELFGMVHAAAAQAVVADRESGGVSVIAYSDGVKSWFEANPKWVPEHLAEVTFRVERPPIPHGYQNPTHFGVVLAGPIEHFPVEGDLLVAVPK